MSKKKQQKNGFFYYMLDLQQDYRERGKDIPMRDMPIFAGSSWSKLSDAEKQKYSFRAKSEKAKSSGTGASVTEAVSAAASVPPADSGQYGRRNCAGRLISV